MMWKKINIFILIWGVNIDEVLERRCFLLCFVEKSLKIILLEFLVDLGGYVYWFKLIFNI